MVKFICFFILIILRNPVFASSQENNKVNQILDSISGEYAECAAYFTIVYHAMVKSNETETANKYGQLQEAAIKYALLLASEGRTTEMTGEVTKARMEMYNKKMKQEANNDNANISILINKYHFQCIEALKDPENHIRQLKEKLENKTNK